MFYLLLFLCGCLTGVSAVLFGFGGGFVVVPLLYHLLQLGRAADDPLAQAAMQVAVATSTCVMIVNAALATYRHRRAGSLLRAYVWPLARTSVSARVLGAALSAWPAATSFAWPSSPTSPSPSSTACCVAASSAAPRSARRGRWASARRAWAER